MASPQDTFAELLRQIENADRQLVEALHDRARAYKAYAELQSANADAYFPLPRDVEVIARARELGDDFPLDALESVLRETLTACQASTTPVTVAYPGPAGSFAHAAVRRHFGQTAQVQTCDTADAVVEAVQRSRTRYGVLPFETTSDGAVTATLQALLASDVRITAELTVAASYHLVSATGKAADIEKVYGAPAALAACDKQLRRLLPTATLIDAPSSPAAASLAKEDHGAAAVGPDFIAKEHGLVTVHERIEDVAGVDVRFAVIGTEHPPRTGLDRTVLAVAVSDEPGALYRCLKSFAERNLNLTRVESRPGRGTLWRYVFFLELDGHITDRVVLTAVEELRSTSPMVKVLGSYPRPS